MRTSLPLGKIAVLGAAATLVAASIPQTGIGRFAGRVGAAIVGGLERVPQFAADNPVTTAVVVGIPAASALAPALVRRVRGSLRSRGISL